MAHTELDRYLYSDGPFMREDVMINVTAAGAETVISNIAGPGVSMVRNPSGNIALGAIVTLTGKSAAFTSPATGTHIVTFLGPNTNPHIGAETEADSFRYISVEGGVKVETIVDTPGDAGSVITNLQNPLFVAHEWIETSATSSAFGMASADAADPSVARTLTGASLGAGRYWIRTFEGNQLIGDAVNVNDPSTADELIRLPVVVKGRIKKEYIYVDITDTTAITIESSMATPKYASVLTASSPGAAVDGTATVAANVGFALAGRVLTLNPVTFGGPVFVELWGV